MHPRLRQLGRVFGPIALSALSLFISFLIIKPFAEILDFDLLANKGVGKIAFSVMAILQICLFLISYSQKYVNQFLKQSVFIFTDRYCFARCSRYFVLFFVLHLISQIFFYLAGFSYYIPDWGFVSISLLLRIFFGFFVAFLLAWSEELIFRGMLYSYFTQFFRPITGILVTSTIFMFVHDLTNPLNLITANWKLGLGLFLLGVLLNLIFFITKKLYPGIGAHMGLVAVKVLIRRVPMVKFLPAATLPFWVHGDLRQSLLIHSIFLITIITLIIRHKRGLWATDDIHYRL